MKKAEKEKTLPKKIAIVWDISSSAAENRDLKKEKELLTAYLKKVKNADINLITFLIFSLLYDTVTKYSAVDMFFHSSITRYKTLYLPFSFAINFI